jgi:hypothetical protein
VNEKPVAWPDKVLRMRPAYFRIFASKIHRARVLQILVETVLRQIVIENASPHFNLFPGTHCRSRQSCGQVGMTSVEEYTLPGQVAS